MIAILKYWKQFLLLGLLVGAFCGGVYVEKNHRDAKLLGERNTYIAAYEKEAQRSYALGQKLATTEKERDAYFKKLGKTKILERVVYSGQCIDDDGLVLLNGYLAGKELPSSGVHGTMPPAIAP